MAKSNTIEMAMRRSRELQEWVSVWGLKCFSNVGFFDRFHIFLGHVFRTAGASCAGASGCVPFKQCTLVCKHGFNKCIFLSQASPLGGN